MQPRQLESNSRLTTRADSRSFTSSLLEVTLLILAAQNYLKNSACLTINSDEPESLFGFFIHKIRHFYGQRSSEKGGPIRNNTPAVLISTKQSEAMAMKIITISSVASPEPPFGTIDSDSNEPKFPYGLGNQHPIVPPRLNDLYFPQNPFKVLATMAVIRQDEENSSQSPEPSDPSPISTPPMNLSTIEGWETPHTTTDDNTFYSEGEPRRVYWDISPDEIVDSHKPREITLHSSPSSTPPPPALQKRKLSMGMSLPQKRECRSTPARHAARPYQ